MVNSKNEIILEMRNITKTFPGVKALDNVNLKVKKGEIHSLCGENGAGKSTLMKVLSGIYPYGDYDGEILYCGNLCKYKSVKDSEKDGIVIIHQELALSPYLSIGENIFLGNEIANHGVIDWHEVRIKTKELLKKVGLDEDPDTIVNKLGVGKQQLIEIAKALSHLKAVAVLDKDDSVNAAGAPLFTDVTSAMYVNNKHVSTVNYIYGIGGRDTTADDIESVFEDLQKIQKDEKVENPYRYLGLRKE